MTAFVLVLALVAGWMWVCFTAPFAAFVMVVAAVAFLLVFVAALGVAAVTRKLLDKRADRRGVPIEGPARPRRTSRAWLAAVLSGGVTEETVKRHDVRKAMRRRLGKREVHD